MTPEKSASTLGSPPAEPLPVAKKLPKVPVTVIHGEGAVNVIVGVSDPWRVIVNTPGIPTSDALLPGSEATCTVER